MEEREGKKWERKRERRVMMMGWESDEIERGDHELLGERRTEKRRLDMGERQGAGLLSEEKDENVGFRRRRHG